MANGGSISILGLLRRQFPVLARMQQIARASVSDFEEVNAIAASPAAGHTARPQAMSERITVALIPAAADHLRPAPAAYELV